MSSYKEYFCHNLSYNLGSWNFYMCLFYYMHEVFPPPPYSILSIPFQNVLRENIIRGGFCMCKCIYTATTTVYFDTTGRGGSGKAEFSLWAGTEQP